MMNIFKYFPSIFVPLIINFITTLIYGNYLDPIEYGKYNIFINNINILFILLFSFMTSSVIRLYSEYNERKEEKFISSYVNTMIILLLIILIILLIFSNNTLYIMLALVNTIFTTFYTNVFRVKDNLLAFNVIKIILPLVSMILLIVFLKRNMLYLNTVILAINIPGNIIIFIITFMYIIKGKLKCDYDKKIMKSTFKFGVPLIITNLLNLLLSSCDRYMLQYFVGDYEVGRYSFGYRISELLMLNITMVIMLALYPKVIKSYEEKGKKEAENLLMKYINVHFFIIVPIILLLFLFSKDVVNLFFKQYIGAEKTINWVTLGTFVYATSMYTNKAFELTKKTDKLVKILSISLIVNIILNLIFIPIYKGVGAIIATFMSYLVYIILSQKYSKNVFTIKFEWKKIAIIIFLNIISFSFVLILKRYIILSSIGIMIIGSIVYILIYIISTIMAQKVFKVKIIDI